MSKFLKLITILFLFYIFICCQQPDNKKIDTGNKESTTIKVKKRIDTTDEIKELKKLLTDEFTIKSESFYIVISNLGDESTDDVIKNTILKATDCFYNNYLDKKPDEFIKIFLFKDDTSYRYWANKLFDDTDLSRFGYYKPTQKTMLMNISTGKGTLVHELTHALIDFDFPDIPSWLNEGLGSLYERSSLNNNEIKGYVNWRLPRLKEAISSNEYKNLNHLINLSDHEFYGSNSDLNYAQARYFCMLMQEKNLLKKFYRSFRDNYYNEKNAKRLIEELFTSNIATIDKEYVAWVKTLKED